MTGDSPNLYSNEVGQPPNPTVQLQVGESTTQVAAIRKVDQAWGQKARGRGEFSPITA
jgi:hypothetical protein